MATELRVYRESLKPEFEACPGKEVTYDKLREPVQRIISAVLEDGGEIVFVDVDEKLHRVEKQISAIIIPHSFPLLDTMPPVRPSAETAVDDGSGASND